LRFSFDLETNGSTILNETGKRVANLILNDLVIAKRKENFEIKIKIKFSHLDKEF